MDPNSLVYAGLSWALTTALSSNTPGNTSGSRVAQEGTETPEFRLYSNLRVLEQENRELREVLQRHATPILHSIIDQIRSIVQRDPALQKFFYENFKLQESVTYAQLLDYLSAKMRSSEANFLLLERGQKTSSSLWRSEPESLASSYHTLRKLLIDYQLLLQNQGQEIPLLSDEAQVKTFTGGRPTGNYSATYYLGQTVYISGTVLYHILSLSLTTVRTLCLVVNTLPRLNPINILMSP